MGRRAISIQQRRQTAFCWKQGRHQRMEDRPTIRSRLRQGTQLASPLRKRKDWTEHKRNIRDYDLRTD